MTTEMQDKTLSDLPTDLHRLILSHDEEKIQLKKRIEALKKKEALTISFSKEELEWAKEWSDDKWDEFKEFVINWAVKGELNEIMEELMDNFISENEGNDEDEEDPDRCVKCDPIPDTEESEECARCKKTFRYYLHDCTCDDCFDYTYFVCKDCEYKMEGCGICGK